MYPRIFAGLIVLSGSLLIFLSACQKDNSQNTTQLKVHLTDNPYNATEVNVDIKEVNVKLDGVDSANWVSLNTHAGIYNLLDFQNGIDTLLAQGVVPTGNLKEIRFVLGSENSITIDSVNYPLTIPSGSESGLKIKVDKPLRASLDSLVIDFDAAMSIFQTGTKDFKLKPVLRVK
ncbi:MAG: DUF4382 domain-containing protein [Chitinophagaceae bacterium]